MEKADGDGERRDDGRRQARSTAMRTPSRRKDAAAAAVPGGPATPLRYPPIPPASQAPVSANSVVRPAVGPFNPARSAMASTGTRSSGLSRTCEIPS
jgi:hypothetical protein